MALHVDIRACNTRPTPTRPIKSINNEMKSNPAEAKTNMYMYMCIVATTAWTMSTNWLGLIMRNGKYYNYIDILSNAYEM